MNCFAKYLPSLFLAFIVSASLPSTLPAAEPFPGDSVDWNGFPRYDFEVAGNKVVVVAPTTPAENRPWVWHGEFFGHKPAPDIELLKRGFHIVYMQIPNRFGSPKAVKLWDEFYDLLTQKYELSSKVALVGLSRGGLYCYNWAIAHPERVACIYADAPVCDFKTWPGGKLSSPANEKEWKTLLAEYGFANDEEALAYQGNPVDQVGVLAKAGVPVLHVVGDADEVVNWIENTDAIRSHYHQHGGAFTLIRKPGIGHHPHGLEKPDPIVNFIEMNCRPENYQPTPGDRKPEIVHGRGGVGNFVEKLCSDSTVRVAYLGGSITAANGWRVKSREWLAQKYPKAKIEEINAAIGGTGSDLGAFRVKNDVLRHKPDLVFVEFAVNDGGAATEQIWRAMEGIVRQIWADDPQTDICFVYTFAVGQEKAFHEGKLPNSMMAMEMLAEHYQIPSINFAKRVVELESAHKLIFKSDEPAPAGVVRFSQDGVHPLDEGHEVYRDVLVEAWPTIKAVSFPTDHRGQLHRSFVKDHWQAAKMIPISQSMLSGDWKVLEDDNSLSKSFSRRLGPIWQSGTPGSKLSFKFRGSQARLYDLVGPNGGQFLITVNGETRPKPVPLFDSYCTYHRLATHVLASNLDAQQETRVTIEIHPEQPDRQPVAFRLKDPEKELQEPKYQGTNLWAGQLLLIGDLIEP